MNKTRSALTTTLVALATLAAAEAAAAHEDKIITADGLVSQIGEFDVSTGIAGAEKAFGKSSRGLPNKDSCEVTWDRLGLTISFRDPADAAKSCNRKTSKADTFELIDPSLSTSRGLRVGMTLRMAHKLHRGARKVDPSKSTIGGDLALRMGPNSDGGRMPIVVADLRRGEITALRGLIGQAGV